MPRKPAERLKGIRSPEHYLARGKLSRIHALEENAGMARSMLLRKIMSAEGLEGSRQALVASLQNLKETAGLNASQKIAADRMIGILREKLSVKSLDEFLRLSCFLKQ